MQARADGRITPTEVQQVEFRLAFRGYNERDVDAFLDRLTEDLSWYLEENQRLRAGGAYAPGPGDAEAAAREAEQIVGRAREEAAATVRRAEQEAAAIRAAGGASTDARGAVAPFLNVEREFLQGLGSLVQSHAEEIKRMVLALRAGAVSRPAGVPEGSGEAGSEPASEPESEPASEPESEVASEPIPEPAEAVSATPPGVPSGSEDEAMGSQAASAAEIRERLGVPEPDQTAEPDRVRVDGATALGPEGAQAGEGRERSLRDLFWGDD